MQIYALNIFLNYVQIVVVSTNIKCDKAFLLISFVVTRRKLEHSVLQVFGYSYDNNEISFQFNYKI